MPQARRTVGDATKWPQPKNFVHPASFSGIQLNQFDSFSPNFVGGSEISARRALLPFQWNFFDNGKA